MSSPVEPPRPGRLAGLARSGVRGMYSLVRPLVRPIAHRGRSFLLSPLHAEFASVRGEIGKLHDDLAVLRSHLKDIEQTLGLSSVAAAEVVRLSTDRVLAAQRRTDWAAREMLSRLTAYAGENITLCYLPSRIPILVNSADDGIPARLIAGIPWEPENLDLLLGFLRPDSVVLDIGANVGYFSVVLGRRLGPRGQLHAVEPHPGLGALLRRNLLINSLENRVHVHQLAASDVPGEADLFYPAAHLGGGSMHYSGAEAGDTVTVRRARLDDVLPADLQVDIVKLDVERHEAAVLRGMIGIIARSPQAIYLIEKLDLPGNGDEVFEILTGAGHRFYGIGPCSRLVPLDSATFQTWSGHVVAGREAILGAWTGPSFSVYPGQLHGRLHATSARADDMLFRGPGWPLPPGRWKLRVVGDIRGALTVRLAEGTGGAFAEFDFSDQRDTAVFDVPPGLDRFEAVGVAGGALSITLERLEFVQVLE